MGVGRGLGLAGMQVSFLHFQLMDLLLEALDLSQQVVDQRFQDTYIIFLCHEKQLAKCAPK
jgi:hypothetical protein